MKYRDLNINFKLESTKFNILNISLEKHITPIPMHSHSKNSYELHYISLGRGILNSMGKKYDITPGALFMTGPKIEHEQISDPECPMTEYCIYLKIEQPENPKNEKLSKIFADTVFWLGRDDGRIRDLMNTTFSELEGDRPGREQMIESLMIQIVLTMIRTYESVTKSAGSSSGKPRSSDTTYLLIEEAFLYDYKSITLDALAKRLGLGTRQTERLLKKHYSKTFQQKKTESRIFAACTLLRESKKSISEISEELGYSSAEHFSSTFKKYCGMTPGEYRKKV